MTLLRRLPISATLLLTTLLVPAYASAQTESSETHETSQTTTEWKPIQEVDPHAGELDERVAMPSVAGPIGLARTLTGDVGAAGHLRVGLDLQLFDQHSLVVSPSAGNGGDYDKRFIGDVQISFTPWKYLELYLGIASSSNSNSRVESNGARLDPPSILVLGNTTFGVKGRLPVAHWLDLGLHLGAKVFSGTESANVAGNATSFIVDLIGSFDLRHAAATHNVPLRFHVNAGYMLDNSIKAIPDSCESSTGNDACIRSRAVEELAYGVAPSRFRFAGAVDAPVTLGHHYLVGLEPFFEYHVEAAVGPGDSVMKKALAGDPTISNHGVTRTTDQYLTTGVRVRPASGLALQAAVDVGLSSFGFAYGPPLPNWNLILGASFDFDAFHANRVQVVHTTVTRETVRVRNEGRVRGMVRDGAAGKALEGAVVRFVGRPINALLTSKDGSFLGPPLPPGPVTVEVSRDDYEPARADVVVPNDGEVAVELQLKAKPPQAGGVRVKVSDDAGVPVVAAVRLTGGGNIIDAEQTNAGELVAHAPPGEYAMDVVAAGYLAKQKMVTLAGGQEQALEVTLHKQPKTSHVSIGNNEIVIKGVIHFGTNNAEIQNDGQQLLDEVADVLVKNPGVRKVRVEGHTDNRGNAEHNLQLSKERAKAVADYLIKQGIDPARLESEGYGSTQPLVPNLTAANRAKNRRVAFKILDGSATP